MTVRICILALIGPFCGLADRAVGRWITVDAPERKPAYEYGAPPGTAWFLKNAITGKTIVRARWTLTAWGAFDAYVNGRKVNGFLEPGFTYGPKRRHLFSYDVTAACRREIGMTNVFAVAVSPSWWSDQVTWRYGTRPGCCGRIEIDCADGARTEVMTDASWLSAFTGKKRTKIDFHTSTPMRFDERHFYAFFGRTSYYTQNVLLCQGIFKFCLSKIIIFPLAFYKAIDKDREK